MDENDLGFIERAGRISPNLYGEPMSKERIVENFALHGLRRRAAALERFDAELGDEIDSSPHNLRRQAQLMDLRRRLGSLHDALRKAGR